MRYNKEDLIKAIYAACVCSGNLRKAAEKYAADHDTALPEQDYIYALEMICFTFMKGKGGHAGVAMEGVATYRGGVSK